MRIRNIKREGLYPPVKPGSKSTKIKVKVGNKTFLIVTHESEFSYMIYIGGRDVYCIEVQLLKPSIGANISQGFFSKIRYDEGCALDTSFIRGEDSQLILKFLLTYIYYEYPYVKTMAYNDLSTRECNDGSKVNLSEMTYIRTGKTWYEKNFDAYLQPEFSSIFKRKEEKFQELKKVMEWDTINVLTDRSYAEYKDLYNSSNTWQEFFGTISDKIGITKFCISASPWLSNFITVYLQVLFIGFTYIIPIKDYDIPYIVQQGGKQDKKGKIV